ncbi:MAG TPA: hypothetical protein DEH78_10510 [Solibacterales bacterium]|nr:hypothetical protein [Bryobacterales bacterium]
MATDYFARLGLNVEPFGKEAVDALAALEEIDAARIFLAGYSLGGKIALWTAALEPRIRGIAAVSAFAPFSAPAGETEGLRHYTHLHGLAPRLASHVPVDYGEIVQGIAGRVLIVAPRLDRYHDVEAVRRAVEGTRAELQTPEDWNRFTAERLDAVLAWLVAQ